jgi:hypothetical protein
MAKAGAAAPDSAAIQKEISTRNAKDCNAQPMKLMNASAVAPHSQLLRLPAFFVAAVTDTDPSKSVAQDSQYGSADSNRYGGAKLVANRSIPH